MSDSNLSQSRHDHHAGSSSSPPAGHVGPWPIMYLSTEGRARRSELHFKTKKEKAAHVEAKTAFLKRWKQRYDALTEQEDLLAEEAGTGIDFGRQLSLPGTDVQISASEASADTAPRPRWWPRLPEMQLAPVNLEDLEAPEDARTLLAWLFEQEQDPKVVDDQVLAAALPDRGDAERREARLWLAVTGYLGSHRKNEDGWRIWHVVRSDGPIDIDDRKSGLELANDLLGVLPEEPATASILELQDHLGLPRDWLDAIVGQLEARGSVMRVGRVDDQSVAWRSGLPAIEALIIVALQRAGGVIMERHLDEFVPVTRSELRAALTSLHASGEVQIRNGDITLVDAEGREAVTASNLSEKLLLSRFSSWRAESATEVARELLLPRSIVAEACLLLLAEGKLVPRKPDRWQSDKPGPWYAIPEKKPAKKPTKKTTGKGQKAAARKPVAKAPAKKPAPKAPAKSKPKAPAKKAAAPARDTKPAKVQKRASAHRDIKPENVKKPTIEERIRKMLPMALQGGPKTKAELLRMLAPQVNTEQLRRVLYPMAARGELVQGSRGALTTFALPASAATPAAAPAPAAPPAPAGRRELGLQERVLGALKPEQQTAADIAEQLGAAPGDVARELTALVERKLVDRARRRLTPTGSMETLYAALPEQAFTPKATTTATATATPEATLDDIWPEAPATTTATASDDEDPAPLTPTLERDVAQLLAEHGPCTIATIADTLGYDIVDGDEHSKSTYRQVVAALEAVGEPSARGWMPKGFRSKEHPLVTEVKAEAAPWRRDLAHVTSIIVAAAQKKATAPTVSDPALQRGLPAGAARSLIGLLRQVGLVAIVGSEQRCQLAGRCPPIELASKAPEMILDLALEQLEASGIDTGLTAEVLGVELEISTELATALLEDLASAERAHRDGNIWRPGKAEKAAELPMQRAPLPPVPPIDLPAALEALAQLARGGQVPAAPAAPPAPKYLGIAAYARHAEVSEGTVRRWLKDGLPHTNAPGRVRIIVAQADAWIEHGPGAKRGDSGLTVIPGGKP